MTTQENGLPPEVVKQAIEDALHGRNTLLSETVVTEKAEELKLSTADLEKIAASLGNSTLSDARLENAKFEIEHAAAVVAHNPVGELTPTATPNHGDSHTRGR